MEGLNYRLVLVDGSDVPVTMDFYDKREALDMKARFSHWNTSIFGIPTCLAELYVFPDSVYQKLINDEIEHFNICFDREKYKAYKMP